MEHSTKKIQSRSRTEHIPPERFQGELSIPELYHLSSCPRCRELLTRQVEERELLSAPSHLKNSILENSRRLDVQLVAGSNSLSRRLQFFYFSLKVSAAVLCALSLLIMTPGLIQREAARRAASRSQWQTEWESERRGEWEANPQTDWETEWQANPQAQQNSPAKEGEAAAPFYAEPKDGQKRGASDPWQYYERIEQFTAQLNELYHLHWEVFDHDKKER